MPRRPPPVKTPAEKTKTALITALDIADNYYRKRLRKGGYLASDERLKGMAKGLIIDKVLNNTEYPAYLGIHQFFHPTNPEAMVLDAWDETDAKNVKLPKNIKMDNLTEQEFDKIVDYWHDLRAKQAHLTKNAEKRPKGWKGGAPGRRERMRENRINRKAAEKRPWRDELKDIEEARIDEDHEKFLAERRDALDERLLKRAKPRGRKGFKAKNFEKPRAELKRPKD